MALELTLYDVSTVGVKGIDQEVVPDVGSHVALALQEAPSK
jgi:hypothetical protein